MEVKSDTLRQLTTQSYYECTQLRKVKACQTWANLCVLQMYNLGNAICQQYQVYGRQF